MKSSSRIFDIHRIFTHGILDGRGNIGSWRGELWAEPWKEADKVVQNKNATVAFLATSDPDSGTCEFF